MDPTFERFVLNPKKVDEIIGGEPGKDFSTVFQHLFPDGNYSASMQSYLNLLPRFEFDIESLPIEQGYVDRLYREFNIERDRNGGVYHFWVFLVKMYHTLTQNELPACSCKRPNFDNIFAFLNGFPIEKTRVVIIGQDPSPNRESSGYAFHGSDCEATYALVRNFFNNDPHFVKNAGRTGGMAQAENRFTKEIFNLQPWIERGVLLFNTYLTFGDYSKTLWLHFTRFLVKQLSSECDCLVFIIASRVATENFENLIDQEKHKVIKVYHPTWPNQTSKELRWDIKRPYHEANKYFEKKIKSLIAWETVLTQQ